MHCIGEYVGRISVFYRHVGMTMKGKEGICYACVSSGRAVVINVSSPSASVHVWPRVVASACWRKSCARRRTPTK